MFGYFVPDRMKAFAEVCRVTKPSGVSIIGTWKFAGLMILTEEFVQFLGRLEEGQHTASFELGNSCSDPVQLRADLIECGFKTVSIHEPSAIFPLPLTPEFSKGWFNNPMIKSSLEGLNHDFLFTEWIRFLQQDKYKNMVDLETKNVVNVEYTALICFATK
jgi:hypothetical protein